MSESEALAYWMSGDKETFVAKEDGVVLGTYYMRTKSGRWRATRLQLRVHDSPRGYRTRDRAGNVRAFAGACPIARLSSDAVQFCGQHERARCAALAVTRL
jgi:hypothetical protein